MPFSIFGHPEKVRLVFMGTPQFAANILTSLIDSDFATVVGICSRPDKPSGRTQEVTVSPVKERSLEKNIPLLQPEKLDELTIEKIAEWKPDIIIVAAYGRILPEKLLTLPAYGCINIHASLLPRWRGASPVQNALLAGDTETGVTVMLMDKGLDTGPILGTKTLTIESDDTTETLLPKLSTLGIETLSEILPLWTAKKLESVPQNPADATICQLIERADGRIVWLDSAESITNRYRALFPWPGVFAFWKRDTELLRVKFHSLSYQKQDPQIKHRVGEVFELGEKVGVQTGEGVVFPEMLQLEGKDSVSIDDFLRGAPDFVGSLLE